jgi:lipopolysaccharide transport system ATP-binding protein
MRFLRNFMKTGSVLFVSHDTSSIKNLCNHAMWIEKGRVVEAGTPKEVCELYLEAFYEANQGKSSTTKLRLLKKPDEESRPLKDQRMEFINTSNLRNDLQIFKFDPDSPSFGKGGAQITSVEFLDKDDLPLAWVVGGEQVSLCIHAVAHEVLDTPIIGFAVKDRLGQILFSDNTYLVYREKPLFCTLGEEVHAKFTFLMPILPAGNYSVNVAIANGTQDHNIQHHWIHDAILFESQSSSVATGLIGIPMQHIKLDVTRSLT